MESSQSQINQVFVKLLEGKHRILNFNTPSISVSTLKDRIETLTSIPSHIQLLLFNNSRILHDHQTLPLNRVSCNEIPIGDGNFPVVVHLLLRLRGGKGGFGSLLRGAATKAGQKKTNNFDACRDMSGRRLRHVNAEKKLEEWRAGAEERRLEKVAEDFLKKKAKELVKSGKRNGGDSSEKYVAKYREDSAKCMEEVEKSVRESVKGLLSSKRKKGGVGSESDSKRLKIWLGKRKFDDTDSEDEDDSDEDKEGENDKFVIIDNGSHSDSSKEADGSSGSITGGKLETASLDQGSSEEEDTVIEKSLESGASVDGCSHDLKNESETPDNLDENIDHSGADTQLSHELDARKIEEVISPSPDVSVSVLEITSVEVGIHIKSGTIQEESLSVSAKIQDLEEPLNFDEYDSAAKLEVLGMERLKAELQVRGLKCGGTLPERAARLFLLKTTPLDMLPKKLFAKK